MHIIRLRRIERWNCVSTLIVMGMAFFLFILVFRAMPIMKFDKELLEIIPSQEERKKGWGKTDLRGFYSLTLLPNAKKITSIKGDA